MGRIRLAHNIGFCNGVRRAIAIAQRTLAHRDGKVYSLGAIIHNPEVVGALEKKGLIPVVSLEEVERGSTVILPSHGSPRSVREAGRRKKLTLVDVTCPYVASVQKICRTLYEQGRQVVIIGDRKHPEIRALLDLAPTALVVEEASQAPEGVFANGKVGIISQTTQSREKFFSVVSRILELNRNGCEFHIYNTICLDTSKRQEEVKQLAGEVDALLVIGSRTSANTKRLLHLGRNVNKRTFLVEREGQVSARILGNAGTIGIISGASAPTWLVTAVTKRIKKLKKP
jgi:(E)-4-hydroxy-3-methyl-but-2-enyl pyrophosphate reductase